MKLYLFTILILFLPVLCLAQVENAVVEDTIYNYEAEEPVIEETYDEMEETIDEFRKPYVAPPVQPVALRESSADKWEKAGGGLDYSKDVPTPPKEVKPKRNFGNGLDWTASSEALGNILQVFAILIAIFAIGMGIYKMLETPQNSIVSKDGIPITQDNLDQYIHETDLDIFLRNALATNDYPLAVRLYFLQSIKRLSETNSIDWSKEKTNREYLREMRAHRLHESFRQRTHDYERIWYGNQPLDEDKFRRLQIKFQEFLGGV
jgi:Domain of unknown function (DUF4129)